MIPSVYLWGELSGADAKGRWLQSGRWPEVTEVRITPGHRSLGACHWNVPWLWQMLELYVHKPDSQVPRWHWIVEVLTAVQDDLEYCTVQPQCNRATLTTLDS